jgi:microcin C transport system permease protein
LGILFVSFHRGAICAGGPVERVIAQPARRHDRRDFRLIRRRFRRATRSAPPAPSIRSTAARKGLDPEFVKTWKAIRVDKPAPERFALMLWNFARFDFGRVISRRQRAATDQGKLPVSCRSDLDDAS